MKFFKYLLAIFLFSSAILAVIFLYGNLLEAIRYKPHAYDCKRKYVQYVVIDSTKNDSVHVKYGSSVDSLITNRLNAYTEKVDSMNHILARVDGQYVATIDLMIDKLNTWIGLWLAILTLILGLISIWQYLRIEKYEDRIRKLEKSNEKRLKELKQFQIGMEDKISQKLQEHHYSTLENRITSILICLSSIPDPQLLYNCTDRKEQLSYYLHIMSELLGNYTASIEKENAKHELPKTMITHIPMVLLNLRLALVRIQGISNKYDVHIFFYELTLYIKNTEEIIRKRQSLENDFVFKLKKILGDFNELISMLDNCNE